MYFAGHPRTLGSGSTGELLQHPQRGMDQRTSGNFSTLGPAGVQCSTDSA